MASYAKLGETSSNPITISDNTTTTTTNSSVASSDSRTGIIDLNHPNRLLDPNATYTADYSVTPSSSFPASADSLANLLLDPLHPTETLTAFPSSAIDISNLTISAPFAQGAFGKIYRGAYNREAVAIKLLERPDYNPERAQLTEQQFLREVMMLATLNHPNIVRFIGACRKPGVWCIVTEYAKGGSLRATLARRGNRTVGVKGAVRRALDVARGMSFVHAHGLIHRDLKSDNLLMFGDKTVKVADFGVARIEARTEGMTPETGTYRWMAPEMIQHKPYSQKVDVYSFGIVLWELVTGMLPFEDMTPIQTAFAVVNKGTRPVIPQHCLPALSELMRHCWDANPDARPPFKDIVMMLQNLESEIVGSPHKAFFRCWTAGPMTED